MSYNKKQVLEANTKAIAIALSNDKTIENIGQLKEYKGFGGIKAILLPPEKPELFADADKNLIEPIKQLHQVLLEYSKDRSEYETYVQSIKHSVLTSFYTPSEIVSSLNEAIKDIPFQRMLEPSAGAGVFLDKINATEKIAIEKDLLTGKILSALHPDKNVMIQGFEKIQRKYEGTFDLVTSNIPFGTVPVFDPLFVNGKDKARRESSRSIHNYFFLKGMDMLQDGGVLAFITSTGVMDSAGNEFLRKALLKEAHLISAVRLPNNLFMNTGGIEVASDLIFLQKDSNRNGRLSASEKLFLSSGNDYTISDYYQDLSHVIHSKGEVRPNQFGKDITVFYQEGGEEAIATKLKEILISDMAKNFNPDMIKAHEKNVYSKPLTSPSGQLSLFEDNLFFSQQMEIPFNIEEDPGKIEYDKYLELKEVYFDLKNTERNNQKENPAARDLLNQRYDSFVGDHGHLLLNRNDLINKDPDFLELVGLERNKDKTIEKADIFFEPVSIRRRIDEVSVNEALNISLNELNFIDLTYIGQLSGKSEDEAKRELLDDKRIYYNPITDEYQTSGVFISGNVVEKRDSLISCIDNFIEDPERTREIKDAIQTLEDAIPEPLRLDEIGINLGERWIPESYYEMFSKYVFNPPGTPEHNKFGVIVTYLSSTDDFVVTRNSYSTFANQKFGVKSYNRRYNYDDVFRFALLDIMPDMTIKKEIDGHEVRIPDTKGIQEMSGAIDEIRKSFNDWLRTIHDYNKTELETIYNSKFRNTVKATYDGSYQTFPDLDYESLGIKELYPSQKDSILMLKINGGGICDHEVGGGKTLVQCVASYEMKRLGLVNKPAILGLKANIYDIAETYQKAYPKAKVLYPTKEELKKDSIDNFLAKIQNNNWDVIILSHEQFEKIPQSDEIKEKILREEIEKLEESLEVLKPSSDKEMRQAYKQLEKRKESQMVKLELVNHSIDQRKGNVIDFMTMGIDHLFIDESHYPNLNKIQTNTFNTQKIKYLQQYIS